MSGDHAISGRLCVGTSCSASSIPGGEIRLEGTGWTILEFENLGTINGEPAPDWFLAANLYGKGFVIEDRDARNVIVSIAAGAPDNALAIGESGAIGLGTSMAARPLHILTGDTPSIRLEQNGSGGFPPYVWDVAAQETALSFRDHSNSTIPVWIEAGGISNALVIENSGEIGLGVYEPAAALHVQRSDGSAGILVEETSATSAPRTLLNLQNNGRPEIAMGNSNTGGEWSFGAGTNFILKQGAVGTDPSVKTKLFEIRPNGDATLAGSLTTGGTSCGGGCDRVFTDQAIIPAQDYAARIWDQGYLPHVGPTPEGAPINVSEKLGGMLNALEHAHVFIDAQNARIATLESDKAALEARVARLEQLVTAD